MDHLYIFNKDKTIVSFYSSDKEWTIKLGPNDYYAAPVFMRGCFYFRGGINIDRFADALAESFKDFDMLLGTLSMSKEGDIFVNYENNKLNQVLEIEDRTTESSINNNQNVIDHLPNKIITAEQQSGAAIDLSGMKMSAFKIKVFNDGFFIGYNINHSMLDLTGVAYYFKYLSQIYTLGNREKINLKKPQYLGTFKTNNIQFKDKDEADQYANKMGFYFIPPNNNSNNMFSQNNILKIEFNTTKLDILKSTSDLSLSKNDVITAAICKVFTFTSNLKDDDIFTLKYMCNIRKLAGLGEEALGNLYIYKGIPLKVSDIRKKSLVELAGINRKSVSEITYEQFKNDLCWFKYIQDEKIDTFGYFIPSIKYTLLSNWNQYDYDQIKFDNATPHSLAPVCIADAGTNFISFNTNENNEKTIITTVSIPPNSIKEIVEFGVNTSLYRVIN
ncbi:hypothetical protein DICPUDRAFT_99515 [Dictyostelium purpureum]|uniref:Condensation domain-containing protein n=1 Tax=Dictyostelium purpureum TaxID=5786 RepID=F0ZZX6_DICPU|nr:uncharacterized protein DICPUDRAFT_99515 [Dictyostelium purpureum]EGC30502.1 hypothetical protein DICPUDRAFT_99515 [Dictyostelium purpureum]|eukprot:XP_003292975.1 hypothetical protein DICPUDRAFT_99515 [Dictyostelium purpureum]